MVGQWQWGRVVATAASGGGQCWWVVGVAMDKLVVFCCVVVVDCVCGFGGMMGDACGADSVGGCLGDRDGWWWWLVGVVSADGLWEWLWVAMIMVVGSFLIEFHFAFLHCCFKGFLHMLALHMFVLKDCFKQHCLLLLLTLLIFNVSHFVQKVNMKTMQQLKLIVWNEHNNISN